MPALVSWLTALPAAATPPAEAATLLTQQSTTGAFVMEFISYTERSCDELAAEVTLPGTELARTHLAEPNACVYVFEPATPLPLGSACPSGTGQCFEVTGRAPDLAAARVSLEHDPHARTRDARDCYWCAGEPSSEACTRERNPLARARLEVDRELASTHLVVWQIGLESEAAGEGLGSEWGPLVGPRFEAHVGYEGEVPAGERVCVEVLARAFHEESATSLGRACADGALFAEHPQPFDTETAACVPRYRVRWCEDNRVVCSRQEERFAQACGDYALHCAPDPTEPEPTDTAAPPTSDWRTSEDDGSEDPPVPTVTTGCSTLPGAACGPSWAWLLGLAWAAKLGRSRLRKLKAQQLCQARGWPSFPSGREASPAAGQACAAARKVSPAANEG